MTERDRRNVSDRIGTTMTDQTNWLWLAKVAGAVGGSAISLAYILPHGRREAATRFAVGVVCGLVFGGTAGLKIAAELGISAATVRTHIYNLYRKAGARSRVELINRLRS